MLKHCTIDNLGKSHLDFWWKLKNENHLQRYYWGNPWEVFPKRALELEIEKDLKSKDIRRVSQYVVKDASGGYAGCIVQRRNLWSDAPLPGYVFVSVIPVDDTKLAEPAINEAFRWLLDMCFVNYKADVACAEPIEDNAAYIAFPGTTRFPAARVAAKLLHG